MKSGIKRGTFLPIFWLIIAVIIAGCGAPEPEATESQAGGAGGLPTPASIETQAATGAATAIPSPTTPIEENTAIPTGSVPQGAIPQGWTALPDPALGYALAYPAEWEICTQTEYSRVFCGPEDTGGPSFPVFYITVIPSGFDNADASAYNYLREDVLQGLMSMEVGSSQAAEAIPEYSTFTRLPDLSIGGQNFVIIENSRVWEAPAGVKDRRALLAVGGNLYMLGTYYEKAEELESFEAVLEQFRLSE